MNKFSVLVEKHQFLLSKGFFDIEKYQTFCDQNN